MPKILQKAERVASGVEHDISLCTLSEEHVAGEVGLPHLELVIKTFEVM